MKKLNSLPVRFVHLPNRLACQSLLYGCVIELNDKESGQKGTRPVLALVNAIFHR